MYDPSHHEEGDPFDGWPSGDGEPGELPHEVATRRLYAVRCWFTVQRVLACGWCLLCGLALVSRLLSR